MLFKESIREAHIALLKSDKRVVVIGHGVHDRKFSYGCTSDLKQEFGNRVIDTPVSEQLLVGFATGASIGDMVPIVSLGRMDFLPVYADQLVNVAAKWKQMHGLDRKMTMVFRVTVGRGKGPTSYMNFQSWLAHVPGIRLLIPTTVADAGSFLKEAATFDGVTVILEHEVLYKIDGSPTLPYRKAGATKRIKTGRHATILCYGPTTYEAKRCKFRSADVIDLGGWPIDYSVVYKSIKKTKKVIVVEHTHGTCSIGAEILAEFTRKKVRLNQPAMHLHIGNELLKASDGEARYPRAHDIVEAFKKITKKQASVEKEKIDNCQFFRYPK